MPCLLGLKVENKNKLNERNKRKREKHILYLNRESFSEKNFLTQKILALQYVHCTVHIIEDGTNTKNTFVNYCSLRFSFDIHLFRFDEIVMYGYVFRPGLGTPFFSVQYVTFFSVLKKKFRSFPFFSQVLATNETQKNVPFFAKERKERNVL